MFRPRFSPTMRWDGRMISGVKSRRNQVPMVDSHIIYEAEIRILSSS